MVELKTTVKSFLRFKTIFADEDIYKILDPNFAVNDMLMFFYYDFSVPEGCMRVLLILVTL